MTKMGNDFTFCSACGLKNLTTDNKCGGCSAPLHKANGKRTFTEEKTPNYKQLSIVIALIIIGVIYYFSKSNNSSNNSSTYGENINSTNSNNSNSNQSDYDKYQIFLATLVNIDNRTRDLIEPFEATMINFANGNSTILDAYDIAEQAENASYNAWQESTNLEIPDLSNSDKEDALTKVKESFSMGYYYRRVAFASAKEYINSRQVKDLSSFVKNINEAKELFTLSAGMLVDIKNSIK
jgi:hypothetical protein